ncbi:hypothetical protein QA612_20850 [Evansella sp. AB-P1]|uniref:hypothetical protein n=1 Tax=Evansella sp. AB-P1 TaxID=3037653 RepID=UPI00241F3AAC|nr:hypothetical protein [Evansella sp. AB-P1]MDG5789909.1 hypothetical protein [Evansella sp. AB-P1]
MKTNEIIEKINKVENKRLENVHMLTKENSELKLHVPELPTKCPGLYWLETNTPNHVFENLEFPLEYQKGLVPISRIITSRTKYLPKINDGWHVVYNGMRKDVRSRIQSHLRKTGEGTGRLGLNAYPVLSKYDWRISFYLMDLEEYNLFSRIYENGWRTMYGWPALCRE